MAQLVADGQLSLPLGGMLIEELLAHPVEEVRVFAEARGAGAILDTVQYVMAERGIPGYLHSALCAMSLPTRRPADEFAPIIHRDGKHSLIINPTERPVMVDGQIVLKKFGVPFGALARLVMLYIMTEAVKEQSREIYLGKSFSAFLRRMGFTNVSSGGVRGTRSLVLDQVDRLMSCEWTFRWDDAFETEPTAKASKGKGGRPKRVASNPVSAFEVNDVRMSHQYGGVATSEGDFVCRFVLSEPFYENLIRHAVPLNERAFVSLKKSPTKIDLYTYLVYRLPRILPEEEVRLSWKQLAVHLGNTTGEMFKFRQTIRDAWKTVSGVYQQARGSVFLDDLVVRLRYAEPPLDGHLLMHKSGKVEKTWTRLPEHLSEAVGAGHPSGSDVAAPALLPPPTKFPIRGSIAYHDDLAKIAREYGSGVDIDLIADRFRKAIGPDIDTLEGKALLFRWERFCAVFNAPRA